MFYALIHYPCFYLLQAESTDTKSRTKHSSPTLERSSITSGKTPNRLGPIDQFVHTSSITMEQRLNKSVQRSRSTAPRSKLARAQLPASSPIETSRDIPVSPQIFDEEAMFLAREEFLNVTNTTSSGDMNTPTTSSGRGRYSTTNEEDFVYPQIGCSPMRLVEDLSFFLLNFQTCLSALAFAFVSFANTIKQSHLNLSERKSWRKIFVTIPQNETAFHH